MTGAGGKCQRIAVREKRAGDQYGNNRGALDWRYIVKGGRKRLSAQEIVVATIQLTVPDDERDHFAEQARRAGKPLDA